MFTGIVTDIGSVIAIDKKGDWRVQIKANSLPLDRAAIGASISCSGVCLTVIAKTKDSFEVQVSGETLSKTTLKNWEPGTQVNLEAALKLGDELGGHLVSGHVDGVARVVSRNAEGDSVRLIFEAPGELAKYLAPKGSAVIEGVSLTINEVEGAKFGVNIIPHTQEATTLGGLKAGDNVNFEADMIARYVESLMKMR